jgi:capsular exopolysaccharide synthesis family protein
MLQTSDRANRSLSQDATTPEMRLPVVSLIDVINFIRRRLRIILLTCLMAWVTALLYLIVAPRTFTAGAALVIESKASVGDPASVSTIVETQIGVIKSNSLARAVIQTLGLLEDPEFVGRAGRDGVIGTALRSIGSLLGWSKLGAEPSLMQRAVESFERKLSAKRVGLTYIVGITFDSADPKRAAEILNTLAETFIAQQMDAKYKSTLRDDTWIKTRLSELSGQASAAQKALEDYHKNGTIDPSKTVDQLMEAADTYTIAYDNFRHMLRRMEAVREQSTPASEVRVLSEATPPLTASSPRRSLVLGISTIAGVLLGIAIGLLRDASNQGIRTGGWLCKELRLACIAVVPTVGPDDTWKRMTTLVSRLAEMLPIKPGSLPFPILSARNGPASTRKPSADSAPISKRALSAPASTERPRSRDIVRTQSPIWTIIDAPQSAFTESFLEIKLAIDTMSRNGNRNQVIGITSTRPNEGKSTIAAALALLMAHAGTRVILLDCNLRNPSLSATLAPGSASGMLDVMTGAVSLSAATWTEPGSQLAFLPAGDSSRPIYASDVLASQSLDKLFKALRESYEYVIVDLPTAGPFADVRAAAHLVDSFILVAEAGRTNIAVLERTLKVCSDMHELMLGVTLNKADMTSLTGFELGS